KAIEQLGSDKLDVRIGSIYALERVARDSPPDHPAVMEVLAAFIREHSHEQWRPPEPTTDDLQPRRTTRPDVQTAITVIGRRNVSYDLGRIDLTGARLTGVNLTGARLISADLTGARLTSADLIGADLTGAYLSGADLTGVNLTGADSSTAYLAGAEYLEG